MTVAPAAMTAAAPAHLFGCEAIDFIARRDGRMGILIGGKLSVPDQRMWHQGRGLRAGRERNAACG